MIVISDTSPLNYLALIDEIDTLPKLFTDIFVPYEVFHELAHPDSPDAVKRWLQTQPAWLRVSNPAVIPPSLGGLGLGEAYAIALAKEIHADALLIDETKGRQIAREHGLRVMGTITVLELAAQRRLLELPLAFNALRRTNFRIHESYLQAALQRDAARKQK